MDLSASQIIDAPRSVVWAGLNSVDVLRASIPGCEEMTGNTADGFEAVVKQKVGPVRATFRGSIKLADVVPGESYRITGEGKGGVAGFAKGAASVRLSDTPDGGTELSYDVTATVGGKIAQLGARIVDSAARGFADSFFERFRAAIEGGPGLTDTDVDAAPGGGDGGGDGGDGGGGGDL
ncbi:MAG: carbon monoxide dehydrogenase subunit G [Pseudomonadota bacterium]